MIERLSTEGGPKTPEFEVSRFSLSEQIRGHALEQQLPSKVHVERIEDYLDRHPHWTGFITREIVTSIYNRRNPSLALFAIDRRVDMMEQFDEDPAHLEVILNHDLPKVIELAERRHDDPSRELAMALATELEERGVRPR